MFNSTLTSIVEIKPLKTISLLKPILAIDNSLNNSLTTKDEQDSSYSLRNSLKNKPTLKDYFIKISYTNNTQPTLTQKNIDFLLSILFLKYIFK
jgi:uncharacterized protein involved in exopolysaccharide biosynthesis